MLPAHNKTTVASPSHLAFALSKALVRESVDPEPARNHNTYALCLALYSYFLSSSDVFFTAQKRGGASAGITETPRVFETSPGATRYLFPPFNLEYSRRFLVSDHNRIRMLLLETGEPLMVYH